MFGEAHKALNAVERQVAPEEVMRAADLIATAHQVAVFGLGGSSSTLAQESQNRLFRYGVMVSAHSDPYVMRMIASTLKPNDVVIAISATGRSREVVDAVALAKHYRAKTICITAPNTDLSQLCDVRLTVAVPEFPDTMKPTASRFAFLAIIDLISVAAGYRLGATAQETLRRVKYNVLSHRKGTETRTAWRLTAVAASPALTKLPSLVLDAVHQDLHLELTVSFYQQSRVFGPSRG
ncbi:MurR/RpiR family transcriptional regulator [Devosia algicola]|uniref:MurR/RpiR family transcriptional regulator n=1 Tax=Devosia algicola TaxID=3026418 RepID=A0ABY7YPD0_9HYPH|nr:MurR/RpiR family transcriptional regulator [Devosia algicola]WDR03109.1 MurR/RpiR family transcriptional regulator [Devosia algicola]